MEMRDKLLEMRQRAETDAAFRNELQTNPDDVLMRETGLSVADLQGLVDQLTDDDLSRVAGGVQGADGDGNYKCLICGETFRNGIDALWHFITHP